LILIITNVNGAAMIAGDKAAQWVTKMGKLSMGIFCYTFGWNAATVCLWNME
jgi:hypothetical protein